MLIFFFKQKTAYEMRISEWSSDVCSSDLAVGREPGDVELPHALDRRRHDLRAAAGVDLAVDAQRFGAGRQRQGEQQAGQQRLQGAAPGSSATVGDGATTRTLMPGDRKSTRLNSSH